MAQMLKRALVFAYGVLSYAVFFLTFLYAIGFIGNMLVPKTLDSARQVTLWQALLTDTILLAIFAVQHSVMARPWFKRVLTRWVPEAAERSTYVLCSSLALIALFAFWQPIGGVLWSATHPAGRELLNYLFGFGFALVLVTTFMLNHFDLFGLRQVWLYLRGREYTHLPFNTPLLYRLIRHPLYLGWLIAFWATPTMTGAHLLFAVMTTAYILIAVRWEERDLVVAHGEKYQRYRESVPMLLPSAGAYDGSATTVEV
jgi:methanethiol S-methyltransferase